MWSMVRSLSHGVKDEYSHESGHYTDEGHSMHRIGYVLPEGFQIMTFSTQPVFELANLLARQTIYEVENYALGGGAVRSSFGLTVHTRPLTARSSADTWIVAGVVDPLSTSIAPGLLRLVDKLGGRARRTC